MNLYEYQAKQLFATAGIPIPEGEVASSAVEAEAIARRLGARVVVKAQVHAGGRGKAGAIRLADTPSGAARCAERILSMSVQGLPVRRVLVERAAEIADEFYVGLVVDRAASCMDLVVSSAGGIDIEDIARTRPQAIVRVAIDPLVGLRPYVITRACVGMGLDRALWPAMQHIVEALGGMAEAVDATLAEVNPLAVTREGQLLALDAKVVVDDSALFRHPDLATMQDPDTETESEARARQAGISYVRLDGQIGCLVNGAGLAMAAMDVIELAGGDPANFSDIGGGAKADRVETALWVILSDPRVASVLINIFGGITRCDEVARGILAALDKLQTAVPLIVRLVGTNEAEGRELLEQAHLMTAPTLREGARLAVAAARSRPRQAS